MADTRNESGWLIEATYAGRPVWWCPLFACDRDWTTDANEAVRFARQIDAERTRQQLYGVWLVATVTEHGFSFPPEPVVGGAVSPPIATTSHDRSGTSRDEAVRLASELIASAAKHDLNDHSHAVRIATALLDAQAEIERLRFQLAGVHDQVDQTDPVCPIGTALTRAGSTTRPEAPARKPALPRWRRRDAPVKRASPQCDHRDDHDPVADKPRGKRCEKAATYRIDWADGRYSFGCDSHLNIDASATVRPIGIVPL